METRERNVSEFFSFPVIRTPTTPPSLISKNNSLLTSIAHKLTPNTYIQILRQQPGEETTISPRQVKDIINYLKDKSPDSDEIFNYVLKQVPLSTITHLINIHKTFPKLWCFATFLKIVKIIPIMKSNNHEISTSYGS